MRHLHALLVASIVLVAGSTAHANDAQRQFLDFSINLGWASAAVELHGDIDIVTASINRAIASFDAAESMIGNPYARERRGLQISVRRKLTDYARATRGKPRRGKASYLRQIWLNYQQSLMVIYRTQSGRAQMIKRTTCDGYIAQIGYQFGRAQIFAGHPPSRSRKSVAIQNMKRAIRGGLRVSFDGYPSRSRRDDKLCCSFGGVADWHSLQNFRTTTPAGHFDRHRGRLQGIVSGARIDSCTGGNPGQVAHRRPHRRRRPPTTRPNPGGHPPRGEDRPPRGGDRPTGGSLPTASFKTSWGTMTFNGRSAGTIATYTTDKGRIVGTARGTTVRGYWVETHSARRCKSRKDGSYYWGRADFQIRGDKLTGKWGYCDNAPSRSWTGTRIRTVIKR
ncbi:MAG: hypothetical protein KJO07_13590 [Deltaproteobacteria bacterium]|nr:hypothetical protein [Deltaproteobacteria bacterium]